MSNLKRLHNTLEEITKLVKDATEEVYREYKQGETFENAIVLSVLENSHDYTVDRLLSIMDYFSSHEFSYEGILGVRQGGKYEIESTNHYFSCGSSMEVFASENEYDEVKWHVGRIEYSDKFGGYYFYNHYGENIKLKIGMLVRVRKVKTRW